MLVVARDQVGTCSSIRSRVMRWKGSNRKEGSGSRSHLGRLWRRRSSAEKRTFVSLQKQIQAEALTTQPGLDPLSSPATAPTRDLAQPQGAHIRRLYVSS